MFRAELLSRGGSGDEMGYFEAFRGRPPRIEPLLRRRGLLRRLTGWPDAVRAVTAGRPSGPDAPPAGASVVRSGHLAIRSSGRLRPG